jgi:hypothetical protein
MAMNVIPETHGSTQAIQPAHLKSLKDYQASRDNLWPSVGSLEWYVRRNFQRLVELGALVKLNGRKLVVAPVFDAAAIELSREAIQRSRRPALLDATTTGAQHDASSGPDTTEPARRPRRRPPPEWFTEQDGIES